MAAGRKTMAPKRGATNASRGRTPSKSAQPKAKAQPPARRTTPTRKVAPKAARGRTQMKRVPTNRTAAQMDAGLAVQFEFMAQELGQIGEFRTELKDVRMLVEALTGMVEGLVANQRAQDADPAPEVISEEHGASAEDADEADTADDQRVPETAEPTPSAL
jgi:hypothetical protein